ncbi:MAG: 16S rRNA (uracil(1498)-N(3))-methyltransferase [Elusimicrobiota bacterium]|jgi:16S rRNA (uracil1498-N3)-methyltransferase|nr:16S rRNA (uracil(1498)-N(3))-methyltransferase [Elusimicrobiota bacterium]
MPHFYVCPQNIVSGVFTISGPGAHYLIDVRRFSIGRPIMLFDGLGASYEGIITEISKQKIVGKILSSSFKKNPFNVNIYVAIPKGQRLDWLIEKCAELGINKLIPLICQRSQLNSLSAGKLERFNKISISASCQCGRNDIMQIDNPIDFFEAINAAAKQENTKNILAGESQETLPIKNILSQKDFNQINIFIGPEGGFTKDEIDFANAHKVLFISLGQNILRIETAAIVAAALIMAQMENII